MASDSEILLDPVTDAWEEHFSLSGSRLAPRQDDRRAIYTAWAYDINDPRRTELRAVRREVFDDYWPAVVHGPKELEDLMLVGGDPTRMLRAAELALRLRSLINAAHRELQKYLVIPKDAPSQCACAPPPAELTLPAAVEAQAQLLPALPF
jgi:hypothetical protein